MEPPKLNKPLLLKMIEDLKTNPEAYDQGTIGQAYEFREELKNAYGSGFFDPRPRPAPKCGTVACLMGLAIILDAPTRAEGIEELRRRINAGGTGPFVSQLTGLPEFLFGSTANMWPGKFRAQWMNAKDYKEQAMAAANMLESVIETDGKILEGLNE